MKISSALELPETKARWYAQARHTAMTRCRTWEHRVPGMWRQALMQHMVTGGIGSSRLSGGGDIVVIDSPSNPYQCVVEEAFLSDAMARQDPLTLACLAYHTSSWVLYVPPGQHVACSLHHLCTGLVSSYVHVIVGPGGSLSLYETAEGSSQRMGLCALHCDIAAEGSCSIFSRMSQMRCLHRSLTASLQRMGRLSLIACHEGRCSHDVYHIDLLGQGSSVAYKDVASVLYRSLSCRETHIRHLGKDTTSASTVKRIVEDHAAARYIGAVHIERGATHACARQAHHGLVRGTAARCDAQPRFDIAEASVHAWHGSTVAPIAEDLVLYAAMRGICADTAEQMFLDAFREEVVQEFPLFLRGGDG